MSPPKGGSLHARALTLSPCPQEAVHWDHWPHSCHSAGLATQRQIQGQRQRQNIQEESLPVYIIGLSEKVGDPYIE